MTKEDYVNMLIKSSGHNIKSFALSINLPYTTLLSMLSRGLGGASIDNVIRVCKGLSLTVEDLLRVEDEAKVTVPFYFTEQEKLVLTKYREKPELQHAVNLLLGINEEV